MESLESSIRARPSPSDETGKTWEAELRSPESYDVGERPSARLGLAQKPSPERFLEGKVQEENLQAQIWPESNCLSAK